MAKLNWLGTSCLLLSSLCIPAESFSPSVKYPPCSRDDGPSVGNTVFINSLQFSNSFRCFPYTKSSLSAGADPAGGTGWIKDAMGDDDKKDDNSSTRPAPPTPTFSSEEIDEMEQLIVSLSLETDDEKRRGKLAEILDKELADSLDSSGNGASDDEESGPAMKDIPRFAQLFQLSLDNVGEKVQNAAREKAMAQQEDASNIEGSSGKNDEEDFMQQLKSPEELQLWALIDMMVQSKTRVKLHMGSLGSKGAFR